MKLTIEMLQRRFDCLSLLIRLKSYETAKDKYSYMISERMIDKKHCYFITEFTFFYVCLRDCLYRFFFKTLLLFYFSTFMIQFVY